LYWLFPVPAGIVLGTIGLLAAALCFAPGLRKYWLGIWLGAALIGAVVGSILIVRESSLRDLRLAGTPLLKFALCLSPSLGAGLVMTAVHWFAGNLHAIHRHLAAALRLRPGRRQCRDDTDHRDSGRPVHPVRPAGAAARG